MIRIGIGGPVGSGKTALTEQLVRRLKKYRIGVVTNDIYTKEDAEFLHKRDILPAEMIIGVETGCCPHSAIREDTSMNQDAIATLLESDPAWISSLSRAAATTWRPRSAPSWRIIRSMSST